MWWFLLLIVPATAGILPPPGKTPAGSGNPVPSRTVAKTPGKAVPSDIDNTSCFGPVHPFHQTASPY